jgi:hypothetical protein
VCSVALAASGAEARFIFFGRFAARLEVVPFPVVLDARREDGVDGLHCSFVGSRPLCGRLRCLGMTEAADQNPERLRVVESHFSQSAREMGHPASATSKAAGEGARSTSKSKSRSRATDRSVRSTRAVAGTVESCGIPLLAKCARNGVTGLCDVLGIASLASKNSETSRGIFSS